MIGPNRSTSILRSEQQEGFIIRNSDHFTSHTMPGMSRSRRRYSRDDATPLINAVLVLKEDSKKGWARFEDALKAQPDLDETDGDGFTALMYAVRLDLPTAIPALVKAGAKVDLRDQDGNTPFHYACMFKQSTVMSTLLKQGAHIDALDPNGFTALLSAVDAQQYELVDVLLKMGADPNNCGRVGTPALVLALSHKTLPCKPTMLRRLIDAGADVNLADAQSRVTPLMRACNPGRPSLEAVKLLLSHGADHSLMARNGRTAVHECLRNLSSLPCLMLLLEAGADPNVIDYQGFTPLSILGHHVNRLESDMDDSKFLATLCSLLHYGADPNILGVRASPNFIMASAVGKSCSYEALRLLLAAGVEPVPTHENSRIPKPSPLAFAFDLRQLEVAHLLADGLVYTCRDTVHITKYCEVPAHLRQRERNLAVAPSSRTSTSSIKEEESEGLADNGRSSPSVKSRASSSGSLLNGVSGSPVFNSPLSASMTSTSGPAHPHLSSQSSLCQSSTGQMSMKTPPRRCYSNTQTTAVRTCCKTVPLSCSSPSLSLADKNGRVTSTSCASAEKTDCVKSCAFLCNNRHNDTTKRELFSNGAAKNNNTNNVFCNGTGCSVVLNQLSKAVSTSNGRHRDSTTPSKHRSSSSSRQGSNQSLNIPRRPSLSEVFSFSSSRNGSPGPATSNHSRSSSTSSVNLHLSSSHHTPPKSNMSSSAAAAAAARLEQEAVETDLHELALLVCYTAPTLQQLCRRAVHRALSSRGTLKNREYCVEQLPICKSLHRYILYQGPEYQL